METLSRTRPARPARRRQPARGAALMFVLIAVVVVTTIGAALVRAMVIDVRQSRVDAWAAQTDWLVEAAANRAAARLAHDTQYRGETWQIDATLLDGRHAAEVDITVTPSDDASRQSVVVTARYPTDRSIFVTRKKTYAVNLDNFTLNNTETQAGEDAP